jgi:hypothetical protein
MNDAPRSPAIAIDRISVRGVDAGTAKSLAPAIERALADAASSGSLRSGHRSSIRLDLPAGASSKDIARALARALGHR